MQITNQPKENLMSISTTRIIELANSGTNPVIVHCAVGDQYQVLEMIGSTFNALSIQKVLILEVKTDLKSALHPYDFADFTEKK